MKNPLIPLLFAFLSLFFLSGCNSSRKTIKSEIQSLTSTQTTIEDNSSFNQSGATAIQTNFNEAVKGSFEFTRIEFNDGTTIEDLFPSHENETASAMIGKRTEPPDSNERAKSGVKAVTTGRLDFNMESQEQTDTQTQQETNLQTSLNKQQDTTTELTQQENSTEKEKHGFFYFLGIFASCFAAGGVLYYLHKFIAWLIPVIRKSK